VSYSREQDPAAIPLKPVEKDALDVFLDGLDAAQRRWLRGVGFDAEPGKACLVPGPDGDVAFALFGDEEGPAIGRLAPLPGKLPPGRYRLDADWPREVRLLASLGWGLATYRFERYKAADGGERVLELGADIADEVEALRDAQCWVRDLVNTPTEDLGPEQLADALVELADDFGAHSEVIVGDDLLTENFPAIHAVGRAADRAPRLARLTWGDEAAPRVALIGKGVCFDTGGLDIKPSAGMLLMKKDMGGAAHVLALARLVMQRRLPVRLDVLVSAVENSISGNAYRPGDVIRTRKGLSVEIGNTDAEGRIVMSDALALATEDEVDLVIDFATLTGAARVALGPDLPPVFSNREPVARAIEAAGQRVCDPLWVMPLYAPYRKMLKSDIADLNNVSKSPFAGCITAALFLEHFVEPEVDWVHIDTFAWNSASRPGRPRGGEALGLRAVFAYLAERYG